MPIAVQDAIREFETMYSEHWGYIWGATDNVFTQKDYDKFARKYPDQAKNAKQWIGRKVTDCSGAFVHLYKKYRMEIPHGSNAIARQYVVGDKLPISKAKAGYVCFKHKDSGTEPDKYKKDKLGDFYHIGLMGNDGLILNARSTEAGFVKSKPSEGWSHCGKLKGLAYDKSDEPEVLMTAVVQSGNGKGANLRAKKTTSSDLVVTVPDGETVDVLDTSDSSRWLVEWNGNEGYCLSKLLTVAGQTLEERVARLEKAVFG